MALSLCMRCWGNRSVSTCTCVTVQSSTACCCSKAANKLQVEACSAAGGLAGHGGYFTKHHSKCCVTAGSCAQHAARWHVLTG
jgi:hypothetical protein